LTINSGSAITTVNASLNNIAILGLGTTNQTGAMTLNNVISATSLVTGSTAYNLVFNTGSSGTSVIGTSGSTAYALTFNNTGTLTINDGTGDSFKVLGSLTISAPSKLYLTGSLLTASNLTIASNIMLAGNSSLDTTANGSGVSGGGAGSTINVSGSIDTLTDATTLTVYAGSAPITFSGVIGGQGGSTYQVTASNLTWQSAEAAAVAAGGHLVTINDATENTYLSNTFNGGTGFWIGLKLYSGSSSSGDWRWVSGAPITFTNWAYGEPNGNASVTSGGAWMSYSSAIAGNRITYSNGSNIVFNQPGGTPSWDDCDGCRLRGVIEFTNSRPISLSINNGQSGAVSINNNLQVKAFNTGSGSYNLSITGGTNTITDATTFANTGTLQIGGSASSSNTFSAGFTATVPSSITLAGTITSNGPTTIGDAGTPISLAAATTIITSGGSSTANRALNLDGSISGANKALTLTTGSGVLTTVGIGSAGNGLGAITISTDEFNPTVNIYGQSTLTIKPGTSGNTILIGGASNNNSDTVLDITATELGYFVNGFTGITFGSDTTGEITLSTAQTFLDPITFTTNGANTKLGANLTGADDASLTFTTPVKLTIANQVITTNNRAINFSSTVNGTTTGIENLTLYPGSADINFVNAVGNNVPIGALLVDGTGIYTFSGPMNAASITVNSGGTTVINTTSLTTTSTQTYHNPVRLSSNTTLATTNSAVTFNSTVNSYDGTARTLTINTGASGLGTVSFNGAVGGNYVLGTTSITAASVVTGAPNGVTVSGGTITMGSNNLTFTTDAIDIGAAITGTGTLTIEPRTASTTMGIAGASGTLNLTNTELNLIQDGFAMINLGSLTGTGKLTVGAYTFNDHVSLRNAGASSGGIQLTGAVSVG
ncbi:MAG: hypothetical protein EBQ83_01230, partial [Burkholderiaceae bacterium]|nr:hypothetical protein [Burkholderiaceae bacterium]